MHGYSSSSESEDDYRRRRRQPAATGNNNDKKVIKKRKLPPQITINRIWKRFSKKKFTKALSVLPFDAVPPPIVSERGNELLTAGYERAAEECRRKVNKIIQECRRVNMRYRDPGFDLVSAFNRLQSRSGWTNFIVGLGSEMGKGKLLEQPGAHQV
jgi:hypothetical protein